MHRELKDINVVLKTTTSLSRVIFLRFCLVELEKICMSFDFILKVKALLKSFLYCQKPLEGYCVFKKVRENMFFRT